MTLTLVRKEFREDGIFSELLDEKGNFLAVTLEHSYDLKPKLYNGEFTCIKGLHRLHNNIAFETFEIAGVKDHTGILLHPGNWQTDSEGCILLGIEIKDDPKGKMVTHSMIAFSKFMSKMEKVKSFQLVVK